MDHRRQPELLDHLKRSISEERLATYLTAAGFDTDRALRTYLWNAQIGEAFHLPIQGVEVGLRNCVNRALCGKYGGNWWSEPSLLGLLGPDKLRDLEVARRRITHRRAPMETSQIVATLSLGFWVGMLHRQYNPQLWSSALRGTFADLPRNRKLSDLAAHARRVRDLRNRIWHHEPIFRMNLSEEYRVVMELLTWICPVTSGWIRPNCRVPQVLRQKP